MNALKQLGNRRHASLLLVSENLLSIDEHAKISGSAGFDFGSHAELVLRSFTQAHGRATKVHSKEAAPDFKLHLSSPLIGCFSIGTADWLIAPERLLTSSID
jgi:hypothetical protein